MRFAEVGKTSRGSLGVEERSHGFCCFGLDLEISKWKHLVDHWLNKAVGANYGIIIPKILCKVIEQKETPLGRGYDHGR